MDINNNPNGSGQFTTYISDWGQDPVQETRDMISKGLIRPNTTIDIAFASFNFDSSGHIPGFTNLTADQLKQIINLVHGQGGKVNLSIGGQTYPFYGSSLYNSPGYLGELISNTVQSMGFDGVDFDVEDVNPPDPNFASQMASVINTLRAKDPSVNITLTIAGGSSDPNSPWNNFKYAKRLYELTNENINSR